MSAGIPTPDMTGLAKAANEGAQEKGFYDDFKLIEELFTKGVLNEEEYRRLYANAVAARVALIHSEASEFLEAFRKGRLEEMPEEHADGLIRYLDLGGFLKYDVQSEVEGKMLKNRGRERMHGGRRL